MARDPYRTARKKGYRANTMDKCVYNKGEGDDKCTIIIYVDVLLITSKNKTQIDEVRSTIEEEFKEIKVKEGDNLAYLGMSLKRSNNRCEINMRSYIKSILGNWSEISLKPYVIPSDDKLFYTDDEASPSKDRVKFHKTVAQLLYLCKRGRPDIALPVHYLCTRVLDPTVCDDKKLERILGYLNNTFDPTWVISKYDNGWNKIEAYIDAAFATHEDGKSQSGTVIFIGG